MDYVDRVIESLGGLSEVARMLEAATSTVHSWKQNGIPRSRLAHLKLAAKEAGKLIDWDTGCRINHDPRDSAEGQAASPGNVSDVSAEREAVR